MSRPFCRKCLIDDLDETAYLRSLKEYIESYPEKQRVADEEYRRRLDICLECEELYRGCCKLCGCYVEVRALKRKGFCPAKPDRWQLSGNENV